MVQNISSLYEHISKRNKGAYKVSELKRTKMSLAKKEEKLR